MMMEILERAARGKRLGKEDAVALLGIDTHSEEFYTLLSCANARSRTRFRKKGYVFAQIGLDSRPCSGNCRFCSMARSAFSVNEQTEKELPDILREARQLAAQDVDALFLMTTADYDPEKFLAIGRAVREEIGNAIPALVANTGDFEEGYARRLRESGFTGAYHIVRLREGSDTDLPPEQRVRTLDAIRAAGLELYYCVEPIGPEHTPEELADEMLRAREYGTRYMAVMRRVNIPGGYFDGSGEVTELEMAKIAAVARLVTDPELSMNVHEPMKLPLLGGVNQLYAESGINPRDTDAETRQGRGFSVEMAREFLRQAEW